MPMALKVINICLKEDILLVKNMHLEGNGFLMKRQEQMMKELTLYIGRMKMEMKDGVLFQKFLIIVIMTLITINGTVLEV